MIESLCNWLASTPASIYFSGVPWIVPTVQSIRIVSMAIVFTSMCMLSSRLLGIAADTRPVNTVARPILSWLWPALLLLLLTGAVMVAAEPERELLNTIFRLRMLLVAIAAAGCWVLRSSLSRNPQSRADIRWRVFRRCAGVFLLIRTPTWQFPTIETVHVRALALMVGSISMLDLRLLGIASLGARRHAAGGRDTALDLGRPRQRGAVGFPAVFLSRGQILRRYPVPAETTAARAGSMQVSVTRRHRHD